LNPAFAGTKPVAIPVTFGVAFTAKKGEEDMARKGELKRAFEQVRSDLFPHWDRKGLWRVKAVPFLAPEGKCDILKKTILIRKIPDSISELKLLLIHEICHHNASGHGAKWYRNMQAVAQRAETIGQQEIAKLIRKEIEESQQGEVVRAATIYGTLADWILDAHGEVPFKRLVVRLAHDHGMSVKQLLENYKRLRRIYDKEIKWLEQLKRARESLAEKVLLP
jgi:hypothetical protein